MKRPLIHPVEEITTLKGRPEHHQNSPLSVHALNVSYGAKPVLWEVEFEMREGVLTAIVGPNGAGKSTLLKACIDLIPRNTGVVEIFGQTFAEARQRVAYVPQRSNVDWNFPVSVLDVVLMGRYGHRGWFKRITPHDRDIAYTSLESVEMSDYCDRQISQLSGGQQQRVFMARALAQQADVFFLDEPFAGVDAATESAILNVLTDLKKDGASIVVVHHDLQTVAEYFDDVLLLNGRIIAHGPISTTFTAKNQQTAYGGRLTLLDDVAADVATRLE